ncbi:hypothetical protein TWF506_003091 [Arthrobotrys conoides]|uniref:Uncharacterized protein n=1 Tax=Arthrobotrys conoides TaxID=74498 RepID=A0AAN8N8E9_9PEZI
MFPTGQILSSSMIAFAIRLQSLNVFGSTSMTREVSSASFGGIRWLEALNHLVALVARVTQRYSIETTITVFVDGSYAQTKIANKTENAKKQSWSIYRRLDARDGLIDLELAPLSTRPLFYHISFEYAGRFPKKFRITDLSIPHQTTIDGEKGIIRVMRENYPWLMKLLLKEEKITLMGREGQDISIEIGDDIPTFNIRTAAEARNLTIIAVGMGRKQ